MQKYIFVIATLDTLFDGDEPVDLFVAWKAGTLEHRNASCFEFELPENVHPFNALLIGRGHAFGSDWCMDGTTSILLAVGADGTAELVY